MTIRPKLELMLKYFNENISLALQERYRDLHEYRKTEVEEGSPREAKVPKISEEADQGGGEGFHTTSPAPPPFQRLLEQPKEDENFVASWLQNSFKMTAAEANPETTSGSALDLRAAPLSLQIPLQQEAQRQFKMSHDFWNRSRPATPGEALEPQPGPPPTPQPPATPDHKIMTEKLVNEIQVSGRFSMQISEVFFFCKKKYFCFFFLSR